MSAHHTRGQAITSAVVLFPPQTGSNEDKVGTESFITELTAAVRHLHKALELSRTPAQFLLPNGAAVTAVQLRLWVAQHTARAQNLIDQISVAYTDPQA
ncbi:hypothetical protein [Streptomyces sp. NPDC004230]